VRPLIPFLRRVAGRHGLALNEEKIAVRTLSGWPVKAQPVFQAIMFVDSFSYQIPLEACLL
jgi:hypothetical protein